MWLWNLIGQFALFKMIRRWFFPSKAEPRTDTVPVMSHREAEYEDRIADLESAQDDYDMITELYDQGRLDYSRDDLDDLDDTDYLDDLDDMDDLDDLDDMDDLDDLDDMDDLDDLDDGW